MSKKEIIETLRAIAAHKQEKLKDTTYSTEYREHLREEINALSDAADFIEKFTQLAYAWKKIFGI